MMTSQISLGRWFKSASRDWYTFSHSKFWCLLDPHKQQALQMGGYCVPYRYSIHVTELASQNQNCPSREADLNHRPKDRCLNIQLQSSALPAELSRVAWPLIAKTCGFDRTPHRRTTSELQCICYAPGGIRTLSRRVS